MRQPANWMNQIIKFLLKSWKTILGFVRFLFDNLIRLLKVRLSKLQRLGTNALNVLQNLNKSVAYGLISLFFFTGIILALFWPSVNNFEGILVVKELSFTSNQDGQLFLHDIPKIREVSVKGRQSLSLNGSFESQSHPNINGRKELKIELVNSNESQLIIRPENLGQTSELEVSELRLQKNTKVKGLKYNSYVEKSNKVNLLSLSLEPHSAPDSAPASLQLYLGEQPLNITLQGYQLKDTQGYQLKDRRGRPEPINLTFKPDNPIWKLLLKQPVYLSINLPDPNQHDSEQWLRGSRMEAKDVKFSREENPGSSVRDSFHISTIIQGQVRMVHQELKIEDNQIITIKKPGIKRLPYIKILTPQFSQDSGVHLDEKNLILKESETTPGLEVRITGQSRGIEVGIDPQLPVASIQANFWANYLSKDAITALISFSSAMIVSLLTWLITNLSETSNS